MSDRNLARRTAINVFFGGADITSSMQPYLLSLTYTDNEEDETDDLQIKLQDRDGIWLEKWLNTAIHAAAEGWTSEEFSDQVEAPRYKVTARAGAAVRSRAGEQYYQYGTLSYGTVITGTAVSGGWVNFMFAGKNAYVKASCLAALVTETGAANAGEGTASKGLKIQATIVRQNWHGDGKDDLLECGQFELDAVDVQGPPNTITIKGTSLPYSSTVRQTLKSKSWESYDLSGIANEIADRNGMTCMFLSAANPSYARVEQYQMSDIAFLQKLCHDTGCSLKVSNNILIVFDQAEYESRPAIKTIVRGKSGYSKYKLSTGANNTYTSCRVSYVTPEGKTISATAYIEGYDKDSEKNQCLEIRQKVASVSEATTLAKNMLRMHNKYELIASFTFPGDPSLLAGCTVRLEGWGAWDGKHMISQAKHKVDHSGYTTQITLRKCLEADAADDSSGASGAGVFSLGDMVMCNEGVTTFAGGQTMQSWVPTAALYVRRIEQNGAALLVSTEQTGNAYTGRVWAKDVHRI